MIEFDNFFSNWNIFYHSQGQRFHPGKNKSDNWQFLAGKKSISLELELNLDLFKPFLGNETVTRCR
jgi:hypothetical protein